MEEDLKSRIDALLDKYEHRLEKETQRDRAEEDFVKRFETVKDRVLRPVMEEIGNHLKSRGLDFHISTGESAEGEMMMQILSSQGARRMPLIKISFAPKDYKKMVLMQAIGSLQGRLDLEEFEIDEIRRDLIGEYIYKVLQKALG